MYRPFQEVASDYPDIPVEDFKKAVQYIAPDGKRSSGAKATFSALANAPGKGLWLWLYRYAPDFAVITEALYNFISSHRSAFHRVSILLWGKDYEPPRYELVSWIFLRLLGILACAAFISFAVQAQGLIGSNGIMPLTVFMDALQMKTGAAAFVHAPMVFWLDNSDLAIQSVCWAGAGFSVLLMLGILPRLSLIILYLFYLSLMHAGQGFMTFQWDYLLIESVFFALILTFARKEGIWLLRWLLFCFMLGSGLVKIASGDESWLNFTTLFYHFQTQPLPTPLAWHAHHLPHGFLVFGTMATLFIELILPFLVFFPRHLRFLATFGFVVLQGTILLTGNYNFFNLNALLLCVRSVG